jgi:hypothetical protein
MISNKILNILYEILKYKTTFKISNIKAHRYSFISLLHKIISFALMKKKNKNKIPYKLRNNIEINIILQQKQKTKMKMSFLIIILGLFVFSDIFPINMSMTHGLRNQKKIQDAIKARLNPLSLGEMKLIVKWLKSTGLKEKQEETRRNREREEKRIKMAEQEKTRRKIIQAFSPKRFGGSSVLNDFFANRIMK